MLRQQQAKFSYYSRSRESDLWGAGGVTGKEHEAGFGHRKVPLLDWRAALGRVHFDNSQSGTPVSFTLSCVCILF